MRLLIILFSILFIIIATGLWVGHTLENNALEFSSNIDEIKESIQQGNWDMAKAKIAKLEDNWTKKGKWWPVIMDHQEIDNILFSLAKTKEYIREEDKVLSLGQLAELRLIFTHLPEKEALNLKNIL